MLENSLVAYMFQFQTGAIKSEGWVDCGTSIATGFNSKLVRLKVDVMDWCDIVMFCFNSKLVRLKALAPRADILVMTAFQFQTGAIKRVGEPQNGLQVLVFQFQTGAIKSGF